MHNKCVKINATLICLKLQDEITAITMRQEKRKNAWKVPETKKMRRLESPTPAYGQFLKRGILYPKTGNCERLPKWRAPFSRKPFLSGHEPD